MNDRLKISASQSAVAHHIINGPFTFPYAVDALSAVARFPEEWSHQPWSRAAEDKAREAAGEEVEPMTAEEQAEFDQHTRAVEDAKERLKAFHEKKAAEKREADQLAQDEAIVASAPPRPARPFGRKGEPTAAERKMMGEKAAKAKAAEDDLAKANARITG